MKSFERWDPNIGQYFDSIPVKYYSAEAQFGDNQKSTNLK